MKKAGVTVEECLFTGDNLLTDIKMGNDVKMDTLLTLSGCTTSLDDIKDVVPKYVIKQLNFT